MLSKYLPTWIGLPRRERLTCSFLCLANFVVVGLFSFFIRDKDIFDLEKQYGLGCLVAVVAFTAVSLYQVAKNERWGAILPFFLIRHRWHLLLWLCCSLIVVSLFPKGYRTVMDEIVILSTSRTIHEEKEPLTPAVLKSLYGINKLDLAYADKRPFLFAAIVALFHDVFGYSSNNSFYANMLLGVGSLALVWWLGRRWGGGEDAGVVALLGLTSLPIFAQHSTGGGIDIINIFMILCLSSCCLRYLEHPNEGTARVMLGMALLLGYSRYESPVYWIIPAFCLIHVLSTKARMFLDPSVAVLPLLAVPLFGLHFLTFSQAASSFQLSDRHLETGFSFSYFGGNLSHTLNFFLDTQHMLTNSPVLFIIGAFSFLLLVVAAVRRMRRADASPADLSFWLFAVASLAGFVLLECYCWGDLDNPVANRLSLPIYLFFVLVTARFLTGLHYRQMIVLALCGIFSVSIYWSEFPLAAKNYCYKLYTPVQRLVLCQDLIKKQPDRRFAVIHTTPNFWLTEDVYCLQPQWLQSNPHFLEKMLSSGDFRRIYWIEDLKRNTKTGEWRDEVVWKKPLPLDLELVSEDQLDEDSKVRISLIKRSSIERLEKFDGGVNAKLTEVKQEPPMNSPPAVALSK